MSKKKVAVKVEAQDAEHALLCDYVVDADEYSQNTRDTAEKCRDYYDSKQLSEAEFNAYKKTKQAPIVINRIKPKMDALMGMEKAAKTTAKAFPRTPKHEDGAEAATEGIRYVLHQQNFEQTRSMAWENLLIEGTCGGEVTVKPKGEEYEVCINHIPWDRLIWDPRSRRKDFGDARYLGQYIWMDLEDAKDKYPAAADILQSMFEGSRTYDDRPLWMDENKKRVKIVELYYRRGGDVYYACFTRGGFCEEPRKSPFVDEDGVTEWPYEFASNFVTRDGERYGAVFQLLDVQDEINKRRSKALHLMSVRQVRGERGAVEDVNKARQELAKPDGYIETTPGMEFEILKTGDMAQAQFHLLEEAKNEIDAVGANAAVQGKDTKVQSGVALQRRQQAGQTEIGPMFDVLRYWQLRIYKKVWKRIKQYWKEEKWVRVTDDESNLRWVGLNKPVTMGEQMIEQAQAQGAPPEALQQLAMQIQSDPRMRQIVDTKNDIAKLDVDIIINEVPDVLTAQIEDFQTLGEMVKSGFPMPPIAVIEASPLSNKDKIIKLMKEQAQLPPQAQEAMQKMQEQMQAVQQQAQQLAQENQALKQDQSIEAAKMQQKAMADQAAATTKAQQQAEDQRLAREQFEFERQLELDKATHAIDLEERKALAAHNQQMQKLEFDKKCREDDTAHRMQTEQAATKEKAENDVMPKIEAMLKQTLTEFEKRIADMQAVSIKPVKDSSGRLSGGIIKSAGGETRNITIN